MKLPDNIGCPLTGCVLWLAANLAVLIAAQQPGSNTTAVPARTLEPGKTISRELRGGESHDYQFTLRAGQYAHLDVDQKSVDVITTAFGPDGERILEDNVNAAGELESSSLIAVKDGTYRIQVQSADEKALAGEYEIKLAPVELATDIHRSRVAAERASSAGSVLYHQQKAEALKAAIPKYEEALEAWRAAKSARDESATLSFIGILYRDLGDKQKSLDFINQGLQVARSSGDKINEAWALDDIGSVHEHFGDMKQALVFFEQALPLWQATRHRAGEQSTLNGMGMAHYELGRVEKALDYFQQAVTISHELRNPSDEAVLLINLGVTYGSLGDYHQELEMETRALEIHRQRKERVGETQALANIGFAYANLSEYQKAMDTFMAAVRIAHELGIPQHEAINLNNVAWVYSTTGDQENAIKYYNQSLELFRKMDHRWKIGLALTNMGVSYAELRQYDKAISLYQEALALHRAIGNHSGEGNALKNMGSAYLKLGDREKALDAYQQAEALFRPINEPRLLAQTLCNLGAISRQTGDRQKAMSYLEEALKVSRSIGDRRDEAESLGEVAHVKLDEGDLYAARVESDHALAIFESLRSTITNPGLRAWFSQAGRKVHEVNLQALLRLHQAQPGAGYDAAALMAAERARARSLLESLGESQAKIREGVDPDLLEREANLRRGIAKRAQLYERLLTGKHTDEQTATAAKELDTATHEYDQLQSTIREKSPGYAALTMPVPLSLAEIRNNVLDDDTVLLEYSLGEEKSFLFATTREANSIFELPKRQTIETAARRVYDLLTARNLAPAGETPQQRIARIKKAEIDYPPAAAELSKIILGPVGARLGSKRLLIVAEGALQYVPFAALPEPQAKSGSELQPLLVAHEVVTAPSASVLALIRHDVANRKTAEKVLAVLADPVFDRDDPRMLQREKAPHLAPVAATTPGEALRAGAESGLQHFERLRFSRREAEQISALVRGPGKLTALDFGANRATAMSPDMAQYRIVHFATHGIINNQHPELSGLVLSLVNEKGEPVDGFLRLYDIYNLKLGADLVVLSACQTALGKEMAGEGLIGLTRGFVYAGTPRVIASLWRIDDRVTSELMESFYRTMLGHGERPVAALRAAQLAMIKTKGWESPYYWAAFTLQGEWK